MAIALICILLAPIAFATQGLYLTIQSYLPHTKIILEKSQCITGIDQLTLNQNIYLKADSTWTCAVYTSYADFSILDTANNQKLASYHLGISTNGSSITNDVIQAPFIQSARLFPHYGLIGSEDRVHISLGINESHWMGDLGDQIANRSLTQLFFPGTHDSGSYAITSQSALMPDAEDAIIKAYNNGTRIGVSIIAGWAKTQYNNTYEQLMSGIRYLDLRICGNGTSIDAIYTCHSLQGDSLKNIVSDVKKYLSAPNNNHEIIILDFNHWANTNQNDIPVMRENALSYVYSELQPWIAPKQDMNGLTLYSPTTKVSSFWNDKKQLIIAVKNRPPGATFNFVWNTVTSASFPSCNVGTDICTRIYHEIEPEQSLQDVTQYLSTLRSNTLSHDYLYTVGISITPTAATIESGLIPGAATPGDLVSLVGSYIDSMMTLLNDPDTFHNISGAIITEDFSNGLDLTELAKKLILNHPLATLKPPRYRSWIALLQQAIKPL